MLSRALILTNFAIFVLTACATSQPLKPDQAQQILLDAWQADRHVVWELDWPAAPIGGPLTLETWRAGHRYRFEILEAIPPALVGQVLVFNGQNAWRYNRFKPPTVLRPVSPVLSPLSDAFTIIDQRLNTRPQTAGQELAQVNFSPTWKVVVTYPNGDTLTLWRDVETGLPVRVVFSVAEQQVTLKARESEPLLNPPEEMFSVGDWIY